MNKVKILDELEAFFLENGSMSLAEYSKRDDAPIRPAYVKRHFNSWTRMETMLNRRLSVSLAAKETEAAELAELDAEAKATKKAEEAKAALEAKKLAKSEAEAEKNGKDSK